MRIGDAINVGLVWFALFASVLARGRTPKRYFRCWLCKSLTEFCNTDPGKYHASCSYCELSCAIVVDRDSPTIQATIGKIELESL